MLIIYLELKNMWASVFSCAYSAKGQTQGLKHTRQTGTLPMKLYA